MRILTLLLLYTFLLSSPLQLKVELLPHKEVYFQGEPIGVKLILKNISSRNLVCTPVALANFEIYYHTAEKKIKLTKLIQSYPNVIRWLKGIGCDTLMPGDSIIRYKNLTLYYGIGELTGVYEISKINYRASEPQFLPEHEITVPYWVGEVAIVPKLAVKITEPTGMERNAYSIYKRIKEAQFDPKVAFPWCLQLLEKFPRSPYAPIGGLCYFSNTYRFNNELNLLTIDEAINFGENLVRRYPNSPIISEIILKLNSLYSINNTEPLSTRGRSFFHTIADNNANTVAEICIQTCFPELFNVEKGK